MNLKATFANIRAALQRRGNSAQDAEDLTQEAWVRLACYEREQAVMQPEAFMMRIALNLSIDAYRTRVGHGEEVLLEDMVLVDATPSAEDALLAREQVARLSVCLGRLSEKTRDIFLAHRVEGLSYREIAEAHGLSISTVEKHVARAMQKVTSWMEGY